MAGRASELVPRGHGRGPHSVAAAAVAAGVFIVHFYLTLEFLVGQNAARENRKQLWCSKMVFCLFGLTIAYELNTRFVFKSMN